MNLRLSRFTLLAAAALCCATSCSQTGSKKKEEDDPVVEDWTDYEKYYSGYNFKTKTTADLQQEIHYYQVDMHRTFVTYENYWYYANTASDLIPGTQNNELFYTGKNVSRLTHDNQDREHVWACANSNDMWYRDSQYVDHQVEKTGYWGGGSDLFHVRPCTSKVNSGRSNAKFTEFTAAEKSAASKFNDGGTYSIYVNSNKSLMEVDDKFKGDVARIIMYMYTHYRAAGEKNLYYKLDETTNKLVPSRDPSEAHAGTFDGKKYSGNVCGELNLTDVLGFSTIQECGEMLMKWNKLDPVSNVEKNRNNYVESIQGNRNPFVDFPQLVNHMFIE